MLLTPGAASQEKIMIPFTAERDVTCISVKIANLDIPDILIDTGFAFDGIIIYNPVFKDLLDLSGAVEVQIAGAGDGEPTKALMVDSASFNLGEAQLNNQRIIVLQSDIYKGFPSNGIIGYSIFSRYITEFDYDKNIMSLHCSEKPEIDSSWTVIPLYFKDNNIPWLDAAVAIDKEIPVSLSMYIDSAAGDTIVLLEKPDMKFSLPKDTVDVCLGRGLSGDIYGKKGSISKLIIGKHELNNVIASFAPSIVRSKQENADAVLGNGALKRFNVIFDYSHKSLYLKPNTHFNDPY